jgi:hypothetical protein
MIESVSLPNFRKTHADFRLPRSFGRETPPRRAWAPELDFSRFKCGSFYGGIASDGIRPPHLSLSATQVIEGSVRGATNSTPLEYMVIDRNGGKAIQTGSSGLR